MKTPCRVRQFLKTLLQKVQHCKVDVIAGDAKPAASKYYKRQEYQDLYKSSVAVMLREMQREVDMGRLCESRLHTDECTNDHLSQLHSPNNLACCCIVFSLLVKTTWTQNYEKTLEQHV